MQSIEKDKKFVALWSKTIHNIHKSSSIISLEYQMIIMSNGSLTQKLNCITGNNINISLIRQNSINNFDSYYNNYIIREIWLKDNHNYKLVFAQSFLNKYMRMCTNLIQKQTMGKSLIESEIDFYKEVQEISYGYLLIIEEELKIKIPIWSRYCIVWHNKKPLTTIKEFFPPVFN